MGSVNVRKKDISFADPDSTIISNDGLKKAFEDNFDLTVKQIGKISADDVTINPDGTITIRNQAFQKATKDSVNSVQPQITVNIICFKWEF